MHLSTKLRPASSSRRKHRFQRTLLSAAIGAVGLVVAGHTGSLAEIAPAERGAARPATTAAGHPVPDGRPSADRASRGRSERYDLGAATETPGVLAPNPAPAAAPASAAPPRAVPAKAPASGVTLSIPSIGLSRSVVVGGQSTIDQGAVTHYWSPELRPRVGPGQPGTYFLAAHHATHGSAFGRLPSLAVGAEVRVTSGGQTYVYTVTSRQVVGTSASDSTIYGPDRSTPRILMQTCESATTRLLVHGVLSRIEPA